MTLPTSITEVSDHALVLSMIVCGRAQWETFYGPTQLGVLRFDDIDHFCELDDFGCPALTTGVRAALEVEAMRKRPAPEATT